MTGTAEVTELSTELGAGAKASVDAETGVVGVDEISVGTGVVEPS